MKIFSEIVTRLDYSKSIVFEEEYFERFAIYKQTSGRCFVVDFELKIVPATGKNITVFFNDDDQTEAVEYIFKGIQKFIEINNNEQIAIKPFEIVIIKAIIHPVDFNPEMYLFYTCKRLNEIAFEIGRKTIYDIAPNVILEENKDLVVPDKLPSISLSNYSISLPNRKLTKLFLPSNDNLYKEFKIGENHSQIQSISILIENNDFKYRHMNRIAFSFKQNSHGINSFISIIDGVKKFADDVSKANYDIGGFNIYILNTNITFYNADFSKHVYWFLKELMISNNKIEYL